MVERRISGGILFKYKAYKSQEMRRLQLKFTDLARGLSINRVLKRDQNIGQE